MHPYLQRFSYSFAALALLATSASGQQATSGYHVTARHAVGGEGGWDYLALDPASSRLFITRGDRVSVVDPVSGRVLGEIPGLNRAHGTAFDDALGRGFVTSGADSTVVMFDLNTLRVLGRIPVSEDADAIAFDPATKRVFTFNGDANSASVIDPAAGRRIATIPLGAKPESGVSAGNGMLYVNLASSGRVAEIDGRSMKVTRTWALQGCEEPTGMAVDAVHQRVFSSCRNGVLAVSDASAGREVTTVPIGSGTDGARFDPATGDVFSSNGEGSLTVIHEDAPDHYTVVQTVPTMPGARTLELDLKTHRIYTASAQFGKAAAGERRAPVVPGSFAVLVVGP
jgi:YVTN family beta-propeller protein